jgi:hypothetical protein
MIHHNNEKKKNPPQQTIKIMKKTHKQCWNRPKQTAQTEANQPKYCRKREDLVEILMN